MSKRGREEREKEREGGNRGKFQPSVIALYHSLADPRKWKESEKRAGDGSWRSRVTAGTSGRTPANARPPSLRDYPSA